MKRLLKRFPVFAVAAGMVAVGAVGAGMTFAAAPVAAENPVTRRLTPEQYANVIADVFGPEIELGGRFEPDMRVQGLLAVGTAKISVTPAGMEQYDAMAQTIAGQVTGPKYRDVMIGCKPKSATAADDACAKQFLTKVGRLLYRRPLTGAETKLQVSAAHDAATTLKDFHAGLALSLAGMLESPQFLFRHEGLEADRETRGGFRLNPYSAASHLSFFLWDSAPDAALLTAAEKGELRTQKGLQKQIGRMVASPRLEEGLRAFFVDMLAFNEFETLTKDGALYPNFSNTAAKHAQEQTLKTLVDLLLVNNGDYRDIFTTRKTYLTEALAAIYAVPLTNDGPNGAPDTWKPYTWTENDPRGGIQAQMSFVALHSPPGRSSPTLRGKALREILLCQKVPPPPGAVPFNIVQDTSNPLYKTARERLTAHRDNPVCAGCHKIIDPMGLALENFDGDGSYRTSENGVKIDSSGELDGVKFADAKGLGQALHDSPAATACVLNRLTSYALGRVPSAGEAGWVQALNKGFADSSYKFPALMTRIASSPEFYRASPPPAVEAKTNASGQTEVQK